MKIAYLGDEYSHTYFAAKKMFEDSAAIFVGCPTINSVLLCVNNYQAEIGVVAIENSVMGSVTECLDSFLDLDLYIHGEISFPITHNLIGVKNEKTEELSVINSHPQAIGQCFKFLSGLNGVAINPVGSTSSALSLVSKGVGAIARKAKDGQVVLREGIEDEKTNRTRFICVKTSASSLGEKVSILFETKNEPGALASVLNVFASLDLNMTHIESRPSKGQPGTYIFFSDFIFNGNEDELYEVLEKIRLKTKRLKFLGHYQDLIKQ